MEDEDELFTTQVTCAVCRADEEDREEWGEGSVTVTSRRIVWRGAQDWSVDMSSVTLHAVSVDPTTFPRPCLYAQVDDDVAEIFFAPDDEAVLPQLFDAFSRSAALNPDEDEEEEVLDDALVERFDAMLTVPGQFDDA